MLPMLPQCEECLTEKNVNRGYDGILLCIDCREERELLSRFIADREYHQRKAAANRMKSEISLRRAERDKVMEAARGVLSAAIKAAQAEFARTVSPADRAWRDAVSAYKSEFSAMNAARETRGKALTRDEIKRAEQLKKNAEIGKNA